MPCLRPLQSLSPYKLLLPLALSPRHCRSGTIKRSVPGLSRVQGPFKNSPFATVSIDSSIQLGSASLNSLNLPLDSKSLLIECFVGQFKCQALIDSGCSAVACIGEDFAQLFPHEKLVRHRKMVGFNGQESTTTHIAKVSLSSGPEGVHREVLPTFVVPGLKYDIILGMPWLKQHNPRIDWSMENISYDSEHCRRHCLTKNGGYPISFEAVKRALDNGPRIQKQMETPEESSEPIPIGAAAFNHLSKRKDCHIFAVSLRDIEKALKPKETVDPRSKLPREYHAFLSLFDKAAADELPPHRPGVDHKIDLLPNTEPPSGTLYGMSRNELEVLDKTLKEYLSKNFIRASKSPAAAPVLFVKKPGGGLRFCVDYRGLNAITVKNRYPIPLIQETLDKLCKAMWFTKLDIVAAFHRIRIALGDEWKTAFLTRLGLYEWNVIPFGLCNAPASFQNFINDTLGRDILDRFVSAYLDDILIFSNSLKEHRQHVKLVLERLTIAGLQLDISKCEFEVHETKYLGLIIQSRTKDGQPGQIRMDPTKITAIQEWETPRNAREIQSFIGFANFYRRFIKDFSKIALPLTKQTRKNVPFEWVQEAEQAFQTLKNAFISSPVLQHFDPDLPCTVETDASDHACGGVLFQPNHEGTLQPVAYFSKRHSPAESNYEIYDKELMAIVRAFEEWRPELEGSPKSIDIITDHRNLEYFMSSKQLSRRQARWSEFLSRFNFIIKYRPGFQCRADGLSRRPQDKAQDANDDRKKYLEQVVLKPRNLDSALNSSVVPSYVCPTRILRRHERLPELSEGPELLNDDTPLPTANQPRTTLDEDITVAYQNLAREDPCRIVREQMLSGTRRSMITTLADCSMDNRRLYYRRRLWIPENEDLRHRCIQECHEQPMVGHPGPAKTYEILQRQFYWPKMMNTVKQQLAKCSVCSRTKPSRERHGQLQALEAPKKRWQHLAMDFVTDLPESKGIFPGATSIWVITDRLTKERHLAPCHSMKKEHLVRMFIHFVIRTHGLPESIVSDRGPQFVSEFWQCLCKRLGIRAKLSTAHHPETDGQSERVNQAMETYLRSYVNYMQDDWAGWISLAEFAMNNYVSEATGMSPFFVNKGFNPRMSFEQSETNLEPQAEDISNFMKELLDQCHAELVWTQATATDTANQNQRRHPAPVYRVGDKVWLTSRNIRTRRPCKKLDDKWIGPYEVKRTIGSTACELILPTALRIFPVFHVSLLRLCETNATPKPIVGNDIDDDTEWEVEDILEARRARGRRPFQFLVRWTGFDEPTWEPASHLIHAPDVVQQFYERNPRAPTCPTLTTTATARRSSRIETG